MWDVFDTDLPSLLLRRWLDAVDWVGAFPAPSPWGPEAATRRALNALALHRRAQVCELGFGLGEHLAPLLQAVPEGQVIGVDPAPEMVQRASRRYVGAVRSGRLQLLQAGSTGVPLADNSMDAVLAVDAARWSDLSTGMREVARILRPSGRLVAVFGADQCAYAPEVCVQALQGCGLGVAIEDQADGTVLVVASSVR